MGDRKYRFHGAGWFKASCDLCHCLVRKRDMEAHALWHARMGQYEPVSNAGTIAPYCDISIRHSGGKPHAFRTGWMTTDRGPK